MSASKAQQAKTAKRRADAIALKLAGLDYDTIAKRLGYASRQAATKDMWRTLRKYRKEEGERVEEWRTLEGRRLDRLQAAAWATALKGDMKAIDTVLKIIAQRAKLFGLEAPVKLTSEMSGPGGGPIELSAVDVHELHRLIGMAGDPDPGDDDMDDLAARYDPGEDEDGDGDFDGA